MRLETESLKPIYIQISEGIEDDILKGVLEEEEQAYSQYQIAKQFNINPATAAKGINLLVDEGILYKKRGLGMYVTTGAKAMIQKKRKDVFLSGLLRDLLNEARKLGITGTEIKQMIDRMEEGDRNESH